MIIFGLAGHVDHGKSALVTALTGAATDRQPEERARGITIDLQAVALRDARDDVVAALVDVPGHEDFVRTMVAGASGVSVLLLVVAADEGVMPQTREHLLVAEQLGVRRGIPVITKADLVEPGWAELVAEDLSGLLAGSSVDFAPAAVVSSHSGRGVADLRSRLMTLAAEAEEPQVDDAFRLFVDKVFVRPGIGTIATGTARSGSLGVGDAVRLLPRGDEARVRSLEVHGTAVGRAGAGHRVAIGLAGLSHQRVHRGDVVVRAADNWQTTTRCDALLSLAMEVAAPLHAGRRVHCHLGTTEVTARVSTLHTIMPGASGLARLFLDRPVVARGGDRLVLRSWSPMVTIGGGMVVDPTPPRARQWPDGLGAPEPSDRAVALVARRRDGMPVERLPQLLGVRLGEADAVAATAGLVRVADRLFAPAVLEDRVRDLLRLIDQHHAECPAEAGAPIELLRQATGAVGTWHESLLSRLAAEGRVIVGGGTVSRPGFVPSRPAGTGALARVLDVVRGAGLTVASGAELARQLDEPETEAALRLAEQQGLVASVERGRWVAREALDHFVRLLREIGEGVEITPAVVRERTGLSRKYLIPLLEWADREGITRRAGDTRVLLGRGSA